MTTMSQQHPSSVTLEWDRVERIRRNQRRRVARLKEKQRLGDTNKWSARHSSSVKMQAAVRLALREWFEAIRSGSGSVHGAQLVDAVVTLGLNHDYKQVQRTVAAEADTADGLLLSPKSFTAALLACCAGDRERERLFRSLRGEGEWRRCGGEGDDGTIGRRRGEPQPAAATENAAAEPKPTAGVPAFITQLTAYRRRVLMATVADKFPTPCTATFWTPDSEGQQQRRPEAVLNNPSEENSASHITTSAVIGAPESGAGEFGDGGELRSDGSSAPCPETTAETGGSTTAPSTTSMETRKRYDAVSEAVLLAKERGQLQSLAPPPARSSDSTSSANSITGSASQNGSRKVRTPFVGDERAAIVKKESASTVGRRPRTSPAREGIVGETASNPYGATKNVRASYSKGGPRPGGRARTTSSTGTSSIETSSEDVERSLCDTAARLRDSIHRKELHTARVEARWDNYRVMKKRWWRRTPISILRDDGLDEADRSYSRLSRPETNEVPYGTGCERYHFADCGSARSSSACQRPSTAPAGQYLSPPLFVRGSTGSMNTHGSTCLTTAGGNSSDINKGAANAAGRKPWEAKPIPFGPIPLNEGRKLRYPLLQLKRDKAKTESACGTLREGDAAKDRGRSSARQGSYVDVPVTRDWKGRWQPHLARVPCGIRRDQG